MQSVKGLDLMVLVLANSAGPGERHILVAVLTSIS